MQQQGLYCVTCGRQTLHNSAGGVNHVLHFLIGFLTCGLWWFVWLGLVIADSPTPTCAFCGTGYSHRRASEAYAEASGIPSTQAPELTPEEKALAARRTWQVLGGLAGLAVLIVLVGGGVLYYFASLAAGPRPGAPRHQTPAAGAPSTSPPPSLTAAEVEAMAKAIRATGERCDKITRQFFQGAEPKSGTRFWNFTCQPGGDYQVAVGPNGGKVLSCSVNRALGTTPCFEAFR